MKFYFVTLVASIFIFFDADSMFRASKVDIFDVEPVLPAPPPQKQSRTLKKSPLATLPDTNTSDPLGTPGTRLDVESETKDIAPFDSFPSTPMKRPASGYSRLMEVADYSHPIAIYQFLGKITQDMGTMPPPAAAAAAVEPSSHVLMTIDAWNSASLADVAKETFGLRHPIVNTIKAMQFLFLCRLQGFQCCADIPHLAMARIVVVVYENKNKHVYTIPYIFLSGGKGDTAFQKYCYAIEKMETDEEISFYLSDFTPEIQLPSTKFPSGTKKTTPVTPAHMNKRSALADPPHPSISSDKIEAIKRVLSTDELSIFLGAEDCGLRIAAGGAQSQYHSERAIIWFLKDKIRNLFTIEPIKQIAHVIIQIKTAHWNGPCASCSKFCKEIANPTYKFTASSTASEDQLSELDARVISEFKDLPEKLITRTRIIISNSTWPNSNISPGGISPVVYCNWLLGTKKEDVPSRHSSRRRSSKKIPLTKTLQLTTVEDSVL